MDLKIFLFSQKAFEALEKILDFYKAFEFWESFLFSKISGFLEEFLSFLKTAFDLLKN